MPPGDQQLHLDGPLHAENIRAIRAQQELIISASETSNTRAPRNPQLGLRGEGDAFLPPLSTGYEGHLTSWHHPAATGQLMHPNGEPPPVPSTWPMMRYHSLESHRYDDATVPAIDDSWVLPFREAHEAGIKYLQKHARRANQMRALQLNTHQLNIYRLLKTRLHPNGGRKISICQIPAMYKTWVELPPQAWLDAFVALPRGAQTMVTPEEYDLAYHAFNTRGLVFDLDQWDAVLLSDGYVDSTQWYVPGLYGQY